MTSRTKVTRQLADRRNSRAVASANGQIQRRRLL